MARQSYSLLSILLVLGSLTSSIATTGSYSTGTLNRTSFPKDFFFGAASSSYQYEGAVEEGGRGPSIWDTFTHKRPDKIVDHSNGDVAADFYHRYKEDIGIMKDMGLDVHRFSIAWPRILPNGKLSGGVNREGVTYYNNFINELLANGIAPWVTIFHWDLPQALEDEFGGFLSPKIVDHFRDYAEVCFKEFGDRVKYWMTLNEPWTFSEGGYASGSLAPGHCSDWQNSNCTIGDSGTEPYMAAHNQLLAHAAAVKLYREKYQATQKGLIGIPLTSHWFLPHSDTEQDKIAAKRALDFMFGWFMDPLTFGDYPQSMRDLVGERLPKFSKEQSQMLKGSFDFIGLNYYTTNYAADIPNSVAVKGCYLTDSRTNRTTERNGIPIGPKASARWLHVYPEGFEDLLLYTKSAYNNPLIYITENGVDDIDTSNLTLEEALADNRRVDYLYRHLYFLRRAIEKGANVKGYIAWSVLDNFEWPAGYTARFGLNYVDFKNGCQRYPKSSAKWFKSFLTREN